MSGSGRNGGAIRVVGICGSLRSGSCTRMAVRMALEGVQEAGAEAVLVDPRELDLAFCDGESDEGAYPAGVSRLRETVGKAHGLILGSPEYHGSFSGVLKNTLDLMGSDQLGGKIVGLVGVSGGQMGAAGALSGLRQICRSVHAWVIPHQASIPRAREQFDGAGQLTDKGLEDRLKEVGRQVARYAFLHNDPSIQQILTDWEGKRGDR